MDTLLHSKLDEIQTEPVVASVTRFSCVRYVPNLERFEFSYIMKFIRIRSSIKKERKREILCALFDNIFTANGRRYGRAGRWVESIAAKSIVEISKHVESSEKE